MREPAGPAALNAGLLLELAGVDWPHPTTSSRPLIAGAGRRQRLDTRRGSAMMNMFIYIIFMRMLLTGVSAGRLSMLVILLVLIAVGSGKVLGKGFRKGTQSQLEFLPERHTDFIFSVLSEEHGFIGSATTLGLFVILYLMAVRIAIGARDKAGALLVVGVFSYLFWAVFVNMGMVIGILPIVGVPLPLLSYGGSSLLTTMTGLGLISSVAYRRYLF